MTLKDKYYEYVLGRNPNETWTRKVLFEIVADFTDRRGLRQEWEQIDDDIQEEILATWLEIIERNFENA